MVENPPVSGSQEASNHEEHDRLTADGEVRRNMMKFVAAAAVTLGTGAVNAETKEEAVVPARNIIQFKAGKKMKNAVEKP